MKNRIEIINNENGSAIVLAVLMLAVLTIIGISSTNTSTIELQIVRNARVYQQNFYKAESVGMEAAQKLGITDFDQLDDRTFTTFSWLIKGNTAPDMRNISNWDSTNSEDSNLSDTKLSAQEIGIAPGSSLDLSATSNLFEYAAWGYGSSNNGHVLIKIGYKKRH